jgi:hypothetical protein
MRRLIILILMSLVCTVPAAAEFAQRQAKSAVAQGEAVAAAQPDQQQNDSQSTQSIEKALRNQLASAGLTDIEMVPTSFVVRAKAADGNPVVLLLYPNSDSEWQVSPLDDEGGHSTSSPN